MDVWHRTFTSTAISHECGEILDPKYQPKKDPDSQKLWKAKQNFMFSILDYVLQTDKGKDLVRKHEDKKDAQAIYKDLHDYRKTSTAASISSSESFDYIAGAT